ncbi:hypothetical protein Tco_0770847 [Tanacetum coccineum]|uniref:Retroviral polymerase SH3-like domain-containing protein n=1 Tax=Tanacetum coccineum TaxID=301880 RepID=A0ABQ4ZF98_9ASTR
MMMDPNLQMMMERSSTVNADGTNEVNVVGGKTSIELSFDLNMHALEDDSIFDFTRDDEDNSVVADMNNLDTTIQVSPNPTIRIHKDHPLDQVIGDLQSATQTRRMSKNLEEHGFVNTIQQRTKPIKTFKTACLLAFYPRKNLKRSMIGFIGCILHLQGPNLMFARVVPVLATYDSDILGASLDRKYKTGDQMVMPYGSAISLGPYTPMIVTTPAVPAIEDSPEVPEKTAVETTAQNVGTAIGRIQTSDPDKAQKDKDMQKNLALIAKYFKKLYKPTNNNLRTSSNTRNKNMDTTPRYKNDNQTRQFGNQRVNVVGARETVGGLVVQQSGIYYFNYKEFGHYAKECRKPKRVKDSTYHKEKMLLCNKLRSYMAKIPRGSNADSCTDAEPLEQVQYDTDDNVFANDIQHFEQSESINNTYGENLDKMKEKGDPYILVGYSTQLKGYRVYNKRTRLIVESIHLRFDEFKEMSETSVANDTQACSLNGQKASDYDNLTCTRIQRLPPTSLAGHLDVLVLLCKISQARRLKKHLKEVKRNLSITLRARAATIHSLSPGALVRHRPVNTFLRRFKLCQQASLAKKQNCTAISSAEAEYVALSASCANHSNLIQPRAAIVIPSHPYRYHFIKEQPFQRKVSVISGRIGMRCLTLAETGGSDNMNLLDASFQNLTLKQKKDGIFISQDIYVAKILKKFGFTEVKTTSILMKTQKPLLKNEDGKEVDVHMYRSMIGSLMYLTSSRPDIMFAVCARARYQVNLKVSHLHDLKRIFKYLKGQPKLGLWYPKDYPFDLVAYSDSDYAGASLDRKYITGGCQILGCRLISWQCMK